MIVSIIWLGMYAAQHSFHSQIDNTKHELDWGYLGNIGPDYWGGIKPE
jgi:carbonic anhydrase